MKKGQIAEGRVDHVVFPNKSVVLTEEGERVVVKNTIPGQKVSFLVNKVRKGKAEGRLLETIEKSPLEVESKCPHFGECGGCTPGGTLSYGVTTYRIAWELVSRGRAVQSVMDANSSSNRLK